MLPVYHRLVLLIALTVVLSSPDAAAHDPLPPHESFTVESAALGETRRINVYTPPDYGGAGADRFPVLYMPDGGLREDFSHVARAVDAAIRASEMRPLIVVGIENTERRRDTTGPTEVESDRKIAPRVSGSAAFRRFIQDDLMPQVRHRYRMTDETAIIGESLAGLFIVETFFLQPELFDTYIALSPSLWWNNEELVKKAGERLKARPDLRKTLYLSSADEENIIPVAARLAETLRTHAPAGLRWQYKPRPDLRHDNIYRSSAPQVLRELFAPTRKASQLLERRPGPCIVVLWPNARRYVLEQDGHFRPAFSLLQRDHHGHLSREGGIGRVKGDRFDDPCRGRELHEPCGEPVFALRGLAAVHLLGRGIEQ